MRKEAFFKIESEEFRQKVLVWANSFSTFLYITGNNHQNKFGVFPDLLAIGEVSSFISSDNTFEKLYNYSKQTKDFLFGHLSYDLKNEIENLHSQHKDYVLFPLCYFFQPVHLIYFNKDGLTISSETPEDVYKYIVETEVLKDSGNTVIEIKNRLSKDNYLEKIEQIKNHLLE